MKTTTKPQTEATTASRVSLRREATLSPPVIPLRIRGLFSISAYIQRLHGPDENSRPLDHGDREKQNDEDAERERNGDRALAAASFLRLGEDDSIWLLIVVHAFAMRPLPEHRCDGADRRCDRADDHFEQEGRKQREQIEDREGKQPACRAHCFLALAITIDVDRKPHHAGAEQK